MAGPKAGVSGPAGDCRAKGAGHLRRGRDPCLRLHHDGASPSGRRIPAYALASELRADDLVVPLDAGDSHGPVGLASKGNDLRAAAYERRPGAKSPAARVRLVKFVFLAVLGALAACYSSAPPPIPLRPVRFLSFSDLTTADTVTGDRGGLARVSTVRRRLRDQGPVLFVLSGDALSPSPASKFFHGQQMIEALNAAQLSYATFGNHEFDLEGDTLLARIGASSFKWLSSNCTRPNGSAFPKVLPWDTVRVSGHKVGLFGLTLQGAYPSYVRCSNPDSAAHRAIETLTSEGADLIVGVTHQPTHADRDLLGREPGLDLVLGGHEEEAQDSVVTGRRGVKADADATTVEFITLWGGEGSWRQAVGRVPIDATLPRDTLVSVVVSRWKDSLRARLGPRDTVGTTQGANPSGRPRGPPPPAAPSAAGSRSSVIWSRMRFGPGPAAMSRCSMPEHFAWITQFLPVPLPTTTCKLCCRSRIKPRSSPSA